MKMLHKNRKDLAKTITDHEEMLSRQLKKKAMELKHLDLPQSVNDPKMPRRKYEERRFEKYQDGYNPAWHYTYQEMWRMDLPNLKGEIEKPPHFFECSICGYSRTMVELGFECCKLDCNRQYCKTCYPFSTTHPRCHGCEKYFCAVCMIRYECDGCGVFVCRGCHMRHDKDCRYHFCSGPCCTHTDFKTQQLCYIADDEENFEDGKRMLTQEEKDEKDKVIKRFIEQAKKDDNEQAKKDDNEEV